MKEREKLANIMRKEGQEGRFRAKEEVLEAQRTGMGIPCQAAWSCQPKKHGGMRPGMWYGYHAVRHDRATLVVRRLNYFVVVTMGDLGISTEALKKG